MKQLIAVCLCLFALNTFSQDTEWDDYFMPGVGYKVYIPKNEANLGIYHGVQTEFVIYARAKGSASYKGGPARVKTYGDLSIMKSEKSEAKDIFSSTLGLNLSFEGSTDRKAFIPYFGLEMGGMFQRDFSTFCFSPVAGVQLYSSKKIIWGVQGGYVYTTKRFDEYSGFQFSSTFNLLLWNK